MRKSKMLVTFLSLAVILAGCGETDSSGSDSSKVSEETTAISTEAVTEEETEASTTASVEENTEASTTESTTSSAEESTEASTTAGAEESSEAVAEGSEENTEASAEENADEDDNPYIVATAASSEDVEAFAKSVQSVITESSWSSLGDMIQYPITIGGKEVADKAAFVSTMEESTVSETFVQAVGAADCNNLFANGQGIMIGNGEVWFWDLSYDAVELKENGTPQFKIIALNGIISE